MSCSRTQHGGGRFRTPDLSLRSPTRYHWATALPLVARVTEFSICTEEPLWLFFLHTLPSRTAFRLEYMLLYQVYAKITTFFYQEKFGTAPLLYVDVETFGGNWRWNNVKTSKMKSKRQNRHADVMHENRLTPPCPVGYARKTFSCHPSLDQ